MDYMGLELSELRDHLDTLDNTIIDNLAERFQITAGVGDYKKRHDLPPFDASREDAIYAKIRLKAAEKGVDPELLVSIWELIITEVKKNHAEHKNK